MTAVYVGVIIAVLIILIVAVTQINWWTEWIPAQAKPECGSAMIKYVRTCRMPKPLLNLIGCSGASTKEEKIETRIPCFTRGQEVMIQRVGPSASPCGNVNIQGITILDPTGVNLSANAVASAGSLSPDSKPADMLINCGDPSVACLPHHWVSTACASPADNFANSWLKLTLDQEYPIGRIIIFNRPGEWGSQIENTVLTIKNAKGEVTYRSDTFKPVNNVRKIQLEIPRQDIMETA